MEVISSSEALGMCVASAYMGRYGIPVDVIMLVLGFMREAEEATKGSPLIWNRPNNERRCWPVLITAEYLKKNQPQMDLLTAATENFNAKAATMTQEEARKIGPKQLDELFNKKDGTWLRFVKRENGTIRPSFSLDTKGGTNFYFHSKQRYKEGYSLIFFKKAMFVRGVLKTDLMKCSWISDSSLEPFSGQKLSATSKMWIYEEVRHDILKLCPVDVNKSLKSQELVTGDILIVSDEPLIVKDGVVSRVK